MIPKHRQQPLAEALGELGANDAQAKVIGDMCFTVCALDASRDAEYLLQMMHDHDPLIRKAAKMMLDTLE